jgi:uncharacterized protein (TIGR02145 family)
MRKIFTILVAVLLTASVFAQSPEKMSYQAVIRNSSDAIVTNTQIGMQISILQGSASGTAVYVETQTPTTNANGLVSIEIGAGTMLSGDFTTIDWANGTYFIKTETDPTGGTSYSITGTSQLLSVPYALHAKTAESVSGTITETDPVFTAWDKSTGISITESQISDLDHFTTADETDPVYGASVASGITATDTTSWNNKLDSETDPVFSTWDKTTGISITESQISDLGNYIETETDPSVPIGTQIGEMQYWNGTAWVTVAATENEGATLQMIGGIPTWVGGTPPTPNVTNPTTGKIWMDRNLGASQVATSSTDANAYGDLYQWGRAADGHESRTSGTTSTLATSDTPGHGNFITNGSSPYDWRNPQNDNLWQGVSGTNNPCPSGYRLPTEAEWEAERTSWSSNNETGAFASPLKLPVSGNRDHSNGSLYNVGSYGRYWSSTVDGTGSRSLYFNSSNADMRSNARARGYSVRCLKD